MELTSFRDFLLVIVVKFKRKGNWTCILRATWLDLLMNIITEKLRERLFCILCG